MTALTFVNDLAEQIFAAEKVARGAVPPPVAELVLALSDGHVGALSDGSEHAWIFAHQTTLLAAQRRMYGRVHVQGARHQG